MASNTKLRDLLRHTVSRLLYPRSHSLAGAVPAVFVAARGYATSKLFIGGLSFATDESSLRDAFSSHGEIVDVKIIIDRDTGRSKGFGFITFNSSEDAEAALSGMDGKIVDGRAIRVDYATEKSRVGGMGGGFQNQSGMGGGFQNQSGFGSGYSQGRNRPFPGGFGRTQGGSFDGGFGGTQGSSFPGSFGGSQGGSFPGGSGASLDGGFGNRQGDSSQRSTGFSQQGSGFPGGPGVSESDVGLSEDSPDFSEGVGGGQSSKVGGSNAKANDDESWDKFFASLSSKKKDTDSSPANEDVPGIDNDSISAEKQVNNP